MDQEISESEATEVPTRKTGGKKWLFAVPLALVATLVGAAVIMIANPPKASVSADCAKPTASEVTITFDGNNFSPECVSVKEGTKVVWINESSNELQVGVNPHPVHSGDKAITNGEFVLTAAPGTSTKQVTAKAGTYGYHDHINASARAVVEVY